MEYVKNLFHIFFLRCFAIYVICEEYWEISKQDWFSIEYLYLNFLTNI